MCMQLLQLRNDLYKPNESNHTFTLVPRKHCSGRPPGAPHLGAEEWRHLSADRVVLRQLYNAH